MSAHVQETKHFFYYFPQFSPFPVSLWQSPCLPLVPGVLTTLLSCLPFVLIAAALTDCVPLRPCVLKWRALCCLLAVCLVLWSSAPLPVSLVFFFFLNQILSRCCVLWILFLPTHVVPFPSTNCVYRTSPCPQPSLRNKNPSVSLTSNPWVMLVGPPVSILVASSQHNLINGVR